MARRIGSDPATFVDIVTERSHAGTRRDIDVVDDAAMTGSIIAPLRECDRRSGREAAVPDVVVWEADGPTSPLAGYGLPIERRLEAAGFTVVLVPLEDRAPTEVELAAPAHVLSGGNTFIDAPVDWLVRAVDRLSTVIDRALVGDASLTGICFGAQLLARLLFGDDAVEPHPGGLQAGFVDVEDNLTGDRHTVSSFHYHHIDRGVIERGGADAVMSSERTPVQAYEFGMVRGVQFHPEWGPAELASALRANSTVTDAYGASIPDLADSIRERADDWNEDLWIRFVVDPVVSVTSRSDARRQPHLPVSPNRLWPWPTAATV